MATSCTEIDTDAEAGARQLSYDAAVSRGGGTDRDLFVPSLVLFVGLCLIVVSFRNLGWETRALAGRLQPTVGQVHGRPRSATLDKPSSQRWCHLSSPLRRIARPMLTMKPCCVSSVMT